MNCELLLLSLYGENNRFSIRRQENISSAFPRTIDEDVPQLYPKTLYTNRKHFKLYCMFLTIRNKSQRNLRAVTSAFSQNEHLLRAGVPGVSILVSDDFGSFAGRVLLKNLMELEVVYFRGQVAHKH